MSNYTKQGFINGEFVLINDDSKELEQLINSWFPDDLFKTYEFRRKYDFVIFDGGQWVFGAPLLEKPAIKASEITEERIIMGSELQIFLKDEWADLKRDFTYRFKPKPDPRISEMIEEAKTMGFNLTFEKI